MIGWILSGCAVALVGGLAGLAVYFFKRAMEASE